MSIFGCLDRLGQNMDPKNWLLEESTTNSIGIYNMVYVGLPV